MYLYVAGGVFVTWRQKDPKEGRMGLYGKTTDEYNNDDHDLFLIDEIITNKSEYSVKHTIGSAAWVREGSKLDMCSLYRCGKAS